MNGNFWFPIEQEPNLKPKAVFPVVFWGTPICLWVSQDGNPFVCADACAGGAQLSKVRLLFVYVNSS